MTDLLSADTRKMRLLRVSLGFVALCLLAGCAAPVDAPTPDHAAKEAFLVAYTRAVFNAAGVAEERDLSAAGILTTTDTDTQTTIIDYGISMCETIQNEPESVALQIGLTDALALDNDNPTMGDTYFVLAVRYLCPQLEDTLREVLARDS